MSILLFLIISFLFNYVLINDATSLPMNKLGIYYNDSQKWECIILGSSKAESNFNPNLISNKADCFNFGLPGTGNKIWYYMLLDELNNQTSRQIIVNIDLSENAILDGVDFNYSYYNKVPRNSELFKALSLETKENVLGFPFYYFGNLKSLVSESLKDHVSLTTINHNGFRGNLNQLTDLEFQRAFEVSNVIQVQFDEEHWLRLFNLIQDSNDTVIFVLSPIYQSNWDLVKYEEFKNNMITLTKSMDRVYFYDFTKSINNKEYFYDSHHLNAKGAETFSIMLRDSLGNN